MPFIQYPVTEENALYLRHPSAFLTVGAFNLRGLGRCAVYIRPDAETVALTYDAESGRYVVWTCDSMAKGHTTFTGIDEAAWHAMHCGQLDYTK